MICVFFPDRIYIGIIHQLGLALARREKEEKKKFNKKKSRQKNPLALSAVSPQDPSALSHVWQGLLGCSTGIWTASTGMVCHDHHSGLESATSPATLWL